MRDTLGEVVIPGQEGDFVALRINPVINSLEQLRRLAATGRDWAAALHVDAGMTKARAGPHGAGLP